MAELLLPSLGADMTAGTLVAWKIKPGDVVTRGQVVAEVETDKGVIDIECFDPGVVEDFMQAVFLPGQGLGDLIPVSRNDTQFAQVFGRNETRFDQIVSPDSGQPSGIGYVGLAARYVFDVARIDDMRGNTGFFRLCWL